MFVRISVIREEERRVAWGAFALLFALMVAHALLDTARDALFLSSIPATRLPIVSLLIAGSALAVLWVQKLLGGRLRRRGSMSVFLGGGALITAALWQALPSMGTSGLYVLYVWSSLLVTMILVEFWLSLGRVLTAQQAKRLYAFVGTGSVAGATAGYAIAAAIASQLGANALLPAAVGVLLIAAVVPSLPRRELAAETKANPTVEKVGARLLLSPYVRKLAGLVLAGTMATTVAGYLFKAQLASSVPAGELGTWFAGINLVLNVSALFVQIVLTVPIVRWLGVTRSAIVLPAALSVGAVSTVVGLGLPAALMLKGAEGTLRHTLSRTVQELLYVPLPERVRSRVKGLIDVVGQRGGQAVAAAGILGLLALGADERLVGGLLLCLIATWIGLAVRLRAPYLSVFRRTLDQLATEPDLDFPDLDMASLETLVEALSSENEKTVVAALEILERQGKTKLVPALLLYHPSTSVVTAALDVFTRAERVDFLPIADALQGNANPTVHSALVRAKSAVAPDEDYLGDMFKSPCRATRTTAAVYLHALGTVDADETETNLEHLRDHANRVTAEMAIARAAPHADTPVVRGVLIELIQSREFEVASEAARSMARIGSAEFLPALTPLLADRVLRLTIADALSALGAPALEYLEAVLGDGNQPDAVRREVPQVLGRFPPMDSVPVLLRALGHADGMVKYRSILTLERLLRATPGLAATPVGWVRGSKGRAQLEDEVDHTLTRIYGFIDLRAVLTRGAIEDPARATDAHAFLERLLHDKQHHAEERLVRLIGLEHPAEDFGSIWRGLNAQQSRLRASSQELLEHLISTRWRRSITLLFGDSTDQEKLAESHTLCTPAPQEYEDLLSALVNDDSVSVRALAVAQVGELGLTHLRPQLRRLAKPATGALHEVLQRALDALEGPVPAAEVTP